MIGSRLSDSRAALEGCRAPANRARVTQEQLPLITVPRPEAAANDLRCR